MIKKSLSFLGLIVLLNCSTTQNVAQTHTPTQLLEKQTPPEFNVINPSIIVDTNTVVDTTSDINIIIRNYENRFEEFKYKYQIISGK